MINPSRNWKFLVVLTAILTVLIFVSVHTTGASDNADLGHEVSSKLEISTPANLDEPLCRFGVNDNTARYNEYDSLALRAGWYVDYRAREPLDVPTGVEYVPIINIYETNSNEMGFEYAMRNFNDRYQPSDTPPYEIIDANPGASWIIGNEPDRRFHQNDLRPEIYARSYNFLYNMIKTRDPEAKIFAGAIVQPTPIRLQYLDLVLASHQAQFNAPLASDGWAIHNFILNEVSCEHDPTDCWGAEIPPGIDDPVGVRISDFTDTLDANTFNNRIVDFRNWMLTNNYGGQPLYISEYGVLFPSDFEGFENDKVAAFMNDTFDYMMTAADQTLGDPSDNYKLVQRWSWFSTTSGPQSQGAYLFERGTNTLTPAGQNYADYTEPLHNEISIQVDSFSAYPVWSLSGVNLQIEAQVTNYGIATYPINNLSLTVYQGDPAADGTVVGTQALSFTAIDPTEEFSLTLSDLPFGPYEFYLEVDVAAIESCIADDNQANVATSLFERTDIFFLPITSQE